MSLRNFIESSSHNISIKAESAAPATSYITNGFVFTWGAVTFNQVMMLIGTILAAATFFVNWHFQKKRDKREQELHQYRILMQRQFRPEDSDS